MSNKKDIWVCPECGKRVEATESDYIDAGYPYCADCDCYMDRTDTASEQLQQTEKDACQFCLGAKGGTPGNENIIGGVVLCDDCHALLCQMEENDGIRIFL